jgi:formate dehydrogenase maturation protein FdhE
MSSRDGGGPHNPSRSCWDERIARAAELATRYPTAADLLSFYAELAEYQKSLVKSGHRAASGVRRPFLEALALEPVAEVIPDFLTWLERAAPARLADAVADMHRFDQAEWRHLVHSYVSREEDGKDETIVFVLEAALQPFAEQLAVEFRMTTPGFEPSSYFDRLGTTEMERAESPIPVAGGRSLKLETQSPMACPLCGTPPLVGVLREEGQGAKRTLVCALCLAERDYLRVVCPACGEQQFGALPVYTAEQFAHVRIEACESCRHYLKTIDLTKDGLAVPPVDDIASVSLDLWARERGYVRLRPNLLRV